LAADGVRELIVVSQDTTYYGIDLYGRPRLADLLRQLDGVSGLEWIRVMYAYPEHIDDALIETLASAKRVVPYLDLPLQHTNDRMLKRMQRRVNRAQTLELLRRLRSGWPGLALRTTFIVGFPGETEEEFNELAESVEQLRFERAGVFTYSFEEGTPATRLDGHLPEEAKQERRDRLMQTQQQIAFAHAKACIGRETEVVVDGPDPDDPKRWLCRGTADAPDIDPVVYVKGKKLEAGQFVRVRVTGADGYDLIARPVGEPR
jgi:ribosomal protein S12 methylthiotransferase